MPLSARRAPLRRLIAFKAYAKRVGARVTESLPEHTPAPGVHSSGSWHYATETRNGVTHSLAADINHGTPGTSSAERRVLAHLVTVAESMGLAVTFALHGIAGSAASHTGHLHVDCGSYSNLGTGYYTPPKGSLTVWDTQRVLHVDRDNLAGPDTLGAIRLLRAASTHGGGRFPTGVKDTQKVVGARPDGVWGRKARRAHDDTVEALQKVWKADGLYKGRIDHIWGPLMDSAHTQFTGRYGR